MRFDNFRSTAVVAFASDAVLRAHNDAHYARMRHASGLFDWEKDVVRDHFPMPPARVLVGAAGLGRESFALAELGYAVTAFEPVGTLVAQMRARRQNVGPPIRIFQGAFHDMPILDRGCPSAPHDLRNDPLFDAAVIGWGSISHLLSDAERIQTLRRFAEVTKGPILASFIVAHPEHHVDSSKGVGAWMRRRAVSRRGLSRFRIYGGYFRLLSAEDITNLAKEVGLQVRTMYLGSIGEPYAVFSTVSRDDSRSVGFR